VGGRDATRSGAGAGRRLLAVLAALLVAGPACTRATGPAPPPARPAGHDASGAPVDPFLRLYGGYAADYNPAATPTELAGRSEAVVLGRLAQIREGRIAGSAADDPGRIEHLVYVVSVTRVLKGAVPGGTAYVAAVKPGFEPAASFDAAAPRGAETVLYLRRAVAPAAGERTIPAAQPPPPGVPLMRFTTPQGFLIRIGDRIAHPLDLRSAGDRIFRDSRPDPHDLYSWLPPELVPPSR